MYTAQMEEYTLTCGKDRTLGIKIVCMWRRFGVIIWFVKFINVKLVITTHHEEVLFFPLSPSLFHVFKMQQSNLLQNEKLSWSLWWMLKGANCALKKHLAVKIFPTWQWINFCYRRLIDWTKTLLDKVHICGKRTPLPNASNEMEIYRH